MNLHSRRDILKLSGLTALTLTGLSAGITTAVPKAAASSIFGNLKLYRRSELMMGTYVTITVVDDSNLKASEAVEAAFVEIKRLENILTRYQSNTPLTVLSERGHLNNPDPALVTVLSQAQQVNTMSQGYFDVTIAPVVDAIRASVTSTGKAPAKAELAKLMELVDAKALKISPNSIQLAKSGMAITLDGLGKGYIVDQAGQILKKYGVRQGLINAGGDILAIGKKGNQPWRVAIVDPTKENRRGPVITLADGAIATSGDYEVYWDEERLHHHIVSPESGKSVYGPVSASVKADNCITADCLSTTLFLMDAKAGFKVLSQANAEGMLIYRSGKIVKFDNFA